MLPKNNLNLTKIVPRNEIEAREEKEFSCSPLIIRLAYKYVVE